MVRPPEPRAIGLGDAVDHYLDNLAEQVAVGQRSARTLDNASADLRDFAALVADGVLVDDITGADIDDALVGFARLPDRRYTNPPSDGQRSMASRQRFHASISALFAAAVVNGWVTMSPMSQVTRKVRNRDRKKQ